MKRFAALFVSLLMILCFSLQGFAWGDVVVDTVPVYQTGTSADSRLLIVIAVSAAILLVSVGTTISLRKQYLSEEEEKKENKKKKK